MEKYRIRQIERRVPLATVQEIPGFVAEEIEAEKQIREQIMESEQTGLPADYSLIDSARAKGKERITTHIEEQIFDINSEYFRALELGADPDEVKLRREKRNTALSLSILLARRSTGYRYMADIKVKMYNYAYDGGVSSPTANNRLLIEVPNSSAPDKPHVLKTRLSTMASVWRQAEKLPEADSLTFYRNVIKQQPIEQIAETEDQFVTRRFIETEQLEAQIRKDKDKASWVVQPKIVQKYVYLEHLLKIWMQRKIEPNQTFLNRLTLGYVFGANQDGDMLELRLDSPFLSGKSIRFPLLERWRRNQGRDQMIRAIQNELRIRGPQDYDFISQL